MNRMLLLIGHLTFSFVILDFGLRLSAQSHQRQLVVGSDPFYKWLISSRPARCARSIKWTRSR